MRIELQVIGASLRSIADEMGAVLVRSAFSANIKERRDCSTALFDARGRMVAQAEHIPVHLGALPDAVAAVRAHDPAPGEAWILNDPFAGGTHLPDITLVTRTRAGFAVTRAHHADVGADEPGSLPADSRRLEEEGVVIPPTRLDDDVLERARRADAQPRTSAAATCAPSSRRTVSPSGGSTSSASGAARRRVEAAMDELHDYSERLVRTAIAQLPDGRFEAADALEPAGGGELELARRAHDRGRRARARLRRHRRPARREPELPARRHALGLLLRRPLPDRPGRARLGRRLRAGARAGAGGLARERARAGGRRGGERRDLEPDRGRRLRRVRPGRARARAGPGDDEQPHARERPLHLLRDRRRRPGRVPGRGRAVRRARGDVEHALDADRGARARLPAARRAARAAARLGRGGRAPRRRRRRPRAARARGLPALAGRRATRPRTAGSPRRRAGAARAATC